ncbi:MAG TPA: tetratricopeptide repeat protein [Kofleriaceae bacterium]|nr:tetratricopeptide repeat protein [Kofleriaceae bacterium]
MARVASGHVRDRPFARTIYALVARRFSGEVTLQEAGRAYRVAWKSGAVVAAASPSPSDSLARIAVDAGILTPAQLSEVLAVSARGKSETDALIAVAGLEPARLTGLKRHAMARRAMRLFDLPNAEFTMDDTVALALDPAVPPLDGRWVIYNGLRNHYDEPRLRAELDFLAGQAVQLRPEALPILEAYGFVEPDRPLISALRDGPLTLEAIGTGATGEERCARLSVVYALAASSCLTASDAPATAAPAATPAAEPASMRTPKARHATPSPPPAPAGPRDAGPVAELIAAKLASIDAGADYFALLGVDQDTPLAELQRVYFELARSLHPDRLRASRVDHPRSQGIFAMINQAFAVLSSPDKRSEYLAHLAAGTPAERRRAEREAEELALKLINAEVAYQRGAVAMKGGNMDAALAAFTEAVELNPDDGEHHALFGWATWCSSADKEAVGKQVRASLRKAITLSPRSATAYFYRGQVAKQSGQNDTAEECFRKVLELEPDHRGAGTELRLLESRTEKTAKKSLFDRLKR